MKKLSVFTGQGWWRVCAEGEEAILAKLHKALEYPGHQAWFLELSDGQTIRIDTGRSSVGPVWPVVPHDTRSPLWLRVKAMLLAAR